jgi:biotin carboxyl carrier protein
MIDEMDKLLIDDTEYSTEVPPGTRKKYEGQPDPSEIRAFIPGTIVDVNVSAGDTVKPGSVILLLDAMKMHNEICSSTAGTVRKVHVAKGDAVQKDQLLVNLIISQ